MFNKPNTDLFSNPYLVNNKKAPIDDIESLYQKLDAIKNQKMLLEKSDIKQANSNDSTLIKRKTVYDDINSLWSELSADEKKFIETSDDYVQANIEYQTAFNSFLLERMGDEFLMSKYGTAPEKILGAIKKKKDEYQNNLSNDISTIKQQNQLLLKQNEELTKNNENLNSLIKSLQEKIWMDK